MELWANLHKRIWAAWENSFTYSLSHRNQFQWRIQIWEWPGKNGTHPSYLKVWNTIMPCYKVIAFERNLSISDSNIGLKVASRVLPLAILTKSRTLWYTLRRASCIVLYNAKGHKGHQVKETTSSMETFSWSHPLDLTLFKIQIHETVNEETKQGNFPTFSKPFFRILAFPRTASLLPPV